MKYNKFTKLLGIFIICLFLITFVESVSAINSIDADYNESDDLDLNNLDFEPIDESDDLDENDDGSWLEYNNSNASFCSKDTKYDLNDDEYEYDDNDEEDEFDEDFEEEIEDNDTYENNYTDMELYTYESEDEDCNCDFESEDSVYYTNMWGEEISKCAVNLNNFMDLQMINCPEKPNLYLDIGYPEENESDFEENNDTDNDEEDDSDFEEDESNFEEENESDEDFEDVMLYDSVDSSKENFNYNTGFFDDLNKNNHSYNDDLDFYNNENQDSNITESNKTINNTNTVIKQPNTNFIYSIISLLISLILSI